MIGVQLLYLLHLKNIVMMTITFQLVYSQPVWYSKIRNLVLMGMRCFKIQTFTDWTTLNEIKMENSGNFEFGKADMSDIILYPTAPLRRSTGISRPPYDVWINNDRNIENVSICSIKKDQLFNFSEAMKYSDVEFFKPLFDLENRSWRQNDTWYLFFALPIFMFTTEAVFLKKRMDQ